MPLFQTHQNDRRIGWPGTAATVVVELLILLAVAFTAVRYVEWSSEAAQAEFTSATKAPDPTHSGEFTTPVQVVKGQKDCDRKG